MIGGTDIVYELRVDEQDVDFVVRFFAAAWPDAVVSVPAFKAEGGVSTFLSRPKFGADEWFFYRDAEARRLWREHGLTPEAADAVVFVTFEEDAICFVVDSEESSSGQLVRDLREALTWNRHVVEAA